MHHLVTGSSGFVGSSIVEELHSRGEKVVSVDIKDDSRIKEISNFYKIDISKKEELNKIKEEISFIHHNAALVPLTKSGKKYFEVNTNGTKNILEFSLKKKIRHLSHMSSSAVFSKSSLNNDNNVDSTHYDPLDTYGVSKYLAEIEIIKSLNLLNKNEISCSIIRPRTIIGDNRLGIFAILFDWVKDNKKIPIIGNGENLFQFAHISDIVEVSIETAVKKKNGFFNIGTDRFSTLKTDLNSFFKEVGSSSKLLPINETFSKSLLFILDKTNLSPLSEWHYLSYSKTFYYDVKQTFDILNWRPKYSNKEMLVNSYYNFLKTIKENNYYESIHKTKPKQKFLKIIKFFL